MERRAVIRAVGGATAVAVAGCLSSAGDGNPDTVLGPPDREIDVDPEDLAYPGYGQELPGVTLPSPLHDTEVSTRKFVGSRETLVTFVFTRCMGPCPALTASLARAQLSANENGYSDEVAFMPVTFDPEADTPERLREFSEINGADPTAENWQFLRPESPQAAQEKLNSRETFGVGFEEVPLEDGGHEGDTGEGEVLEPDGQQETTFVHTNLLLLVNRDGYVERAYSPQPPRPDIVISDLESVREGYE